MRILITLIASVFFMNIYLSQNVFDRHRINKAMKLNSNLAYKAAEDKLKKVNVKPKKDNKDLFFKYSFLTESFDKYNDRISKYPKGENINGLKEGLESINKTIRLWHVGVDKNKMTRKYKLNAEKLFEIQDFFKSRIKDYEDSIRRMDIEIQKEIEISRQKIMSDSIKNSIRVNDSIVNEINIEIPKTAVRTFNKISLKTLTKKYGAEISKRIEYKISIEKDGLNKIYKFSVVYDSISFKSGKYRGKYIDYILKNLFHDIRPEIKNSEILMRVLGSADAVNTGDMQYNGDLRQISKTRYKGMSKFVSLNRRENINNYELAFLRAYNAIKLFDNICKRDVTEVVVTDCLVNPNRFIVQDKLKGQKYRSVGFVLVINNYYKDLLDGLPEEYLSKIIDTGKELRVKSGDFYFGEIK